MEDANRFPGWGRGQVAILLDFAHALGITSQACLAGSGIVSASLCDQDPTLMQELVVIRNLLRIADAPPFALGLSVGRNCTANSLGLMGQALLAAPTVSDLAGLVTRYFSANHHFLKITIKPRGRTLLTTFSVPDYFTEHEGQFLLGRDMGAGIAFQENLLGGRPSPARTTEVGFTGRPLPGMSDIGAYYQCPVMHHRDSNYLISKLHLPKALMPWGSAFLSRMFTHRLDQEMGLPLPQPRIQSRIEQALLQQGYADITREQMARELNVSPRTLARYLRSEGTNWRHLVSRLRMARARELLQTTTEPVEWIAEEVGFGSASSFSAAFSREMGCSPSEYRRIN